MLGRGDAARHIGGIFIVNKRVIGPTLGLLVVGTMSLAACSGGSTTRSTASRPSTSPSDTSSVSTSSASPSSSSRSGESVGGTPRASQPTGDAAASAVASVVGGEATYPSSCDQAGTTEVPVHLHDGTATLPHGSELRLEPSPAVTKVVTLDDGHTYRLVTLECLPPAGAGHSQLFVYLDDRGSSPHLLGEPIKVADGLQVSSTGEQDGEGLVVSARGWSAQAPDCCPDQSRTYFLEVSPRGVTVVSRPVQPLTR